MRFVVFLIFILIQINFINAICSEGQIDINNADKEKLTELTYIGEVRAERIIESRPFSSLDELTKVNGIGEIILEKIKEQGLACVDREDNKDKNVKRLTSGLVWMWMESIRKICPEQELRFLMG